MLMIDIKTTFLSLKRTRVLPKLSCSTEVTSATKFVNKTTVIINRD